MFQWDQPDLLLLLCDVTAPGSLEAVTAWHKVAQSAEWAGGRAAPLAGLLFANKTDLTKRRLISSESASQLASKLGLHYVEGSAVSCDLLSYSGNTCNSWGLAVWTLIQSMLVDRHWAISSFKLFMYSNVPFFKHWLCHFTYLLTLTPMAIDAQVGNSPHQQSPGM